MTSTDNNKKKWIKPVMSPFRSGGMNKFGTGTHTLWKSDIDGIAIDQLMDTFGSPLFIVSERTLRKNFKNAYKAFSSRYPEVTLAWSYKTNYLGAVCNTFHQEGALAEVVSAFEYEKARSLGIPGEYIILNGPHKPRELLERAIEENATINVDHLDELYMLEELAQKSNRRLKIGLRLNFDTTYAETWSRFGFNVETGQAMDAAWRIHASKYLELNGLHSHIGTFITDTRAYRQQANIMCDFMMLVEEKTGCTINYLDLGGGFASLNSLQGVYLPADQVVPSMDQYAEVISEVLLEKTHERSSQGKDRPQLILESGRALVDDAVSLASSIIANKRLADGRRAIVVDAGVNVLFTAFWYNHNVIPTSPLEGKPEETVIYGPLCMNIDVIRSSIMLPPLNVGDTLVFSPAGAYNHTQWLQFIEYRPNVVMIDCDGATHIIREAENLEVVTQQEKLPAHLSNAYPHGKPVS